MSRALHLRAGNKRCQLGEGVTKPRLAETLTSGLLCMSVLALPVLHIILRTFQGDRDVALLVVVAFHGGDDGAGMAMLGC